MYHELLFSVRALTRNKWVTLVIISILSLGIGSASAIFRITDRIYFSGKSDDQNVVIVGSSLGAEGAPTSMIYEVVAGEIESQINAFTEFAVVAYQPASVVVKDVPIGASYMGVTENFFKILDTEPRMGRGFLTGDETDNQVVVVSYKFWQRNMGGGENALGQTVIVDNAVCKVVGVLGRDQLLPEACRHDIYRPRKPQFYGEDSFRSVVFLGKLRPPVSINQAQAALDLLKTRLTNVAHGLRSDSYRARIMTFSKFDELLERSNRPTAYNVAIGAVVLLYLIACLNASNLMASRLLRRQKEICIRVALGSTRFGIVKLILSESMLLTALGTVGGVLISLWMLPVLLRLSGIFETPIGGMYGAWDWRVTGATMVLGITTVVAISILPLWHVLRSNIAAGLQGGTMVLGENRRMSRVRDLLIVLQASFAVILLTGAGLMSLTFIEFSKVDLGFDQTNRARIQFSFPNNYLTGKVERLNRIRAIEDSLKRVHGVISANASTDLLLPIDYEDALSVRNSSGTSASTKIGGGTVGFQDALGLNLLRGQWLSKSDGEGVMISDSLARKLFSESDPVGQYIVPVSVGDNATWKGWRVVGVVSNIKVHLRNGAANFIYGPEGWDPSGFNTIALRFTGDFSAQLETELRKQLFSADSRLIVGDVRPVSQLYRQQLRSEHLALSVFAALSFIAVILTTVGIFSALVYSIDIRRAEFGLRIALGAQPVDLLRIVFIRTFYTVLAGLVIGIAGAVAVSHSFEYLLYGVRPFDLRVIAATAFVLLLVALIGSITPALRATKADPNRLLREL